MFRSYCNIRCKKTALILLLVFYRSVVYAQSNFNGVLINKIDSSIMPYSSISVLETGKNVLTDDKGVFVLAVPPDVKQLTFTISAIGYKATLRYKRTFSDPEKVYVDMIPNSLNEVTVTGVSPRDIAEKAIAAIPDNYMDSDYYSFSLYRQYQEVNNVFRNLFEAQLIVEFKLSESKTKLFSKEKYSQVDMRRTTLIPAPDNLFGNDLAFHMTENPVYHLATSALDPHKFASYTFSFDTAESPGNYIVDYTCRDFSTESHGVVNYASYDFNGESWETGKLVIDKESFAIKKIERTSYRYPKYDYPKVNNLVQPERRYYAEFLKAEMIADYVFFQGKWYLKQLVHSYTNEFFNAFNNHRDCVITDCFEWYAESISKQLPEGFNGKFYTELPNSKYNYNSKSWADMTTPFYFYNKDAVYRDLERNGPLDLQFYDEGRKGN